MLLGTLDASLLGYLLTDKEAIAMTQGQRTIRAGEETIRAGQDLSSCLILWQSLK